MEQATLLQVLSQLVTDGVSALAERFMQRINRCETRRQAVAYRPLPVMLCGTLPGQPVEEADPRFHGLDSQRAALGTSR